MEKIGKNCVVQYKFRFIDGSLNTLLNEHEWVTQTDV